MPIDEKYNYDNSRLPPYKKPDEALKAENDAIKESGIVGPNSKSTITKNGIKASGNSNSSGNGSAYKDPKIKDKAARSTPATPKNVASASDALSLDAKAGPAIDVLANMAFPEEVDLSDNDPYKLNKDIAKEYIDMYRDRVRTRDRTDLGPGMALTDFWTKGKSNLAGSYKAPESVDSIYKTMMMLLEQSQKNSDDGEIKKEREKTDSIYKLYVKPRETIASMIANLKGVDAKAQASIANAITKMQTDSSITNARLQTLLDMNGNSMRTRSANDSAQATYRSDKLGLDRDKYYSSAQSTKRVEWIKAEREESKMLASKLLGKDLNNDSKWKESEKSWHQMTRNMGDKVVRDHGLVEANNGDYHAAQMQAFQIMRDNYDPETDSFPHLPSVDNVWQKFRAANRK
jgi:hypothetical protein